MWEHEKWLNEGTEKMKEELDWFCTEKVAAERKDNSLLDGSVQDSTNTSITKTTATLLDCYNPPYIDYDHAHASHNRESSSQLIIPSSVVQVDGSYIRSTMDAKKARFESNTGKSF